MNRRELLRQLAFGIPAGLIFPSLLTSCKDENLLPYTTYKGKVIIIGAGVSGLYAAYLLKQQGVDVSILEADMLHGGRIRPLRGFADFTVELGAEEVHGSRSVFYDLVRSLNAEFINDNTNDYIQIDGALKKLSDLEDSDSDIKTILELSRKMDEYNGGDLTADQYAQQQGYAQRVLALYEALFGTEYGTSNDRLGMQGVAAAERLWSSGDQNFMLKNQDILSLLEQRFTDVTGLIRYGIQVQSVLYNNSSTIALVDQNGATYTCDKLIVTVPLTVLRDGDISFSPPLDSTRRDALQRIGMGAGMKIILKFSSRFWPDDTGTIYSQGHVPEYWVTGLGGRSASNNILTAFVHGRYAEDLLAMGQTNMINTILAELDVLYGAGAATNSFVASHVMNWGAQPFIRGTYSYPKPGSDGARETIAQPIDNRIFFAGEHTHTGGHFATVHGAMETGFRAVRELLDAVRV